MSATFSKDTIQFLTENRLRNDKAWFTEHKPEYQQFVVEPFVDLLNGLAEPMKRIDSQLTISPKVGGSISRIYRDTRFSKEKLLFRDNMWISLLRQKGQMLPEFFFVIAPDNFFYGTGYYAADSASMDSIREMILTGHKSFKNAQEAVNSQELFSLEGDMYKRSRYKDQPEELRNWLDRKVISVMRTSTDWDMLYSENLASVVAQQFMSIAPVYHFFIEAEARVRKGI